MKAVLTTGDVARICRVASRTVSKWFDSGQLRGYRIPGSQDRRIPREELVKFLKRHGMPLGELEEEGRHRVLIVGAEQHLLDRLKELLPDRDNYRFEFAGSGFEAGVRAERFRPHAILIDMALSRNEAMRIAQTLRLNPGHEQTLIVALANEDEAAVEALVYSGFNEVFKKPFDIALLAERIHTLLEGRRRDVHS